jgi:hypothetical protein
MDHFEPPSPSAEALPAADLQAPADQSQNVVHEAFPVFQPETDANDFLIRMRASTLYRCRNRLSQLTAAGFPWHEVLLALSMLSFGGVLGALPADLEFQWFLGVFFYSFLPAIGLGSAVAFFFTRKQQPDHPTATAKEVLEDLPDPDTARQ